MWQTPEEEFPDVDAAVRWWLGAHFVMGDDAAGTWAIDMYASYLEACVQTKALPVCTVQLFGRIMAVLAPRSPFRTEKADGERKYGRKYAVRPKEDTTLVEVGHSQHGAKTAADLYKQAQEATGYKQTMSWIQFRDQIAEDKRVLEAFLESQRLKRPDQGVRVINPPSVATLFSRAKKTEAFTGWTESRFRRALGSVARVKRGNGGAHQVAELAPTENA
jgi:hypothetical protein